MKVGIITPLRYLSNYQTDLQLCYAVLLPNPSYQAHYKSKKNLILDSSPKLPRRDLLNELLLGIKLVNPTLIVLPSIDYSWERTVTLVEEFLRRSKSKQELIGVVQGVDLDTLSKCYKFLKGKCSVIGLPSPLETIARREEIARDLGVTEKVLYIEVYANPYEEVPPANSMGIYTSYPVRLAAALRKLDEFSPTPPPLDFFKKNLVEELVSKNIAEYREVVNERGKR